MGSKRVASAHEENRLSSKLPDRVPVEEFLVRRAQKGDREAFASLIDTYWDALYRWMYRLTRHRQTAEDLTQETFLKAYARLQSFQAGTNFHAWVFRIGFNTFANHRRDNARVRESLPEQVEARRDGPVEEAIDRESKYAFEWIRKAPNNESPWNYVEAMLGYPEFELVEPFEAFAKEIHAAHPLCKEAPSFLVEVYAKRAALAAARSEALPVSG